MSTSDPVSPDELAVWAVTRPITLNGRSITPADRIIVGGGETWVQVRLNAAEISQLWGTHGGIVACLSPAVEPDPSVGPPARAQRHLRLVRSHLSAALEELAPSQPRGLMVTEGIDP